MVGRGSLDGTHFTNKSTYLLDRDFALGPIASLCSPAPENGDA